MTPEMKHCPFTGAGYLEARDLLQHSQPFTWICGERDAGKILKQIGRIREQIGRIREQEGED